MGESTTKSTPVKRSGSGMVAAVVGALMTFGISIYAFTNNYPIGAGIALLGAVLVFFLASSIREASCPVCSEAMNQIATGVQAQCPQCFTYSTASNGQFRECDPDSTTMRPGLPFLCRHVSGCRRCAACAAPRQLDPNGLTSQSCS